MLMKSSWENVMKKSLEVSAAEKYPLTLPLRACSRPGISLMLGGLWALFTFPAVASGLEHGLSFEDRVACQTSIEEVYYRHRIWPADNPTPKPSFASVVSNSPGARK